MLAGTVMPFPEKEDTMLKEFVEKILTMAAVQRLQIHGLEYADRAPVLVTPPNAVRALEICTLSGLVTAIRSKVDDLSADSWVFDVASYRNVNLISRKTDCYGRREVLVRVESSDGEPFLFNRFYPREEFVIGLQSRFVQDEALAGVLRLASTLEASTVAIAEDDGISQRTTVRQGVALKEQVTVKGRVLLRPFRTFREVDQPASEFVFRLRSVNGEVPQCALFEADGGKWKLDAMLTIKAWLESEQLGIPVIA